jgi:biopolymer transport protein TolR
MKKARRKHKRIADINVVPYIDVMLVLLIIFMVTTPLLSQGVKVDLPKAAAKVLPNQNVPIIVSLDHNGNYYLNIAATPEAPINTSTLGSEVAAALQKNPERRVYVRADQSVNYGKVISAMVLLQQAGANSVGLMTDTNDAPKTS